MPQARKNSESKATRSLSDGNPTELSANQKLVKAKDGSVWLVETTQREYRTKDGKLHKEDVIGERRVDSPADKNEIARGGTPWYVPLLEKQEKAKTAEKSASKQSQKTPKGDDK